MQASATPRRALPNVAERNKTQARNEFLVNIASILRTYLQLVSSRDYGHTRSDADESSNGDDSCDALRWVSSCSAKALSKLAYGDGSSSFEHSR